MPTMKQLAQEARQRMQNSLTPSITEEDKDLMRLASANGARVATDDVCQHCGGYGTRRATEADLPFMVMDEVSLASFKRGDIFNVPCEHCKDQRRAEFVKKWQDKSRFTDEERLITFDTIKLSTSTPGTAEVKRACQEMVGGTAYMLTIQGASGNAKSVALMATVNAFLKRGDSALYITLTDALDWIKDAFNIDRTVKDDDTALGRYKQLEYASLLVLDEMQDANESGWTLSILANLVNRRQREAIDGKCFTIFCTNKPVETLPAQILSRMKDGRNRVNGAPIVINNDKDLRSVMKRKAKK